MANTIDILFNALTGKAQAQINSFNSGLESKLKGLAAQVTAAFGVERFIHFTKGAIDSADAAGKLSQKVAVAVETVSQLQHWLNLSDVSTEEFADGMRYLNDRIATGHKLFADLGISTKNTDGSLRSADAVLLDVADAMSGFADDANKSRLAVELFGRSGARWIPALNEGREGFNKAAAESDRFGATVSQKAAAAAQEFNDNLTRLNLQVKAVFLQMSELLLPVLKGVSEDLLHAKENASALHGVLKLIALSAEAEVLGWNILATGIQNLGTRMGAIAGTAVEQWRGYGDAASKTLGTIYEEINARERKLQERIAGSPLAKLFQASEAASGGGANGQPPALSMRGKLMAAMGQSKPSAPVGRSGLVNTILGGDIAIAKASIEADQADLQRRYEQMLIDVDDFYQQKAKLAGAAVELQKKELAAQGDPDDPVQRAKLVAALAVIEEQWAADRNQIEAEAATERKRIFDEEQQTRMEALQKVLNEQQKAEAAANAAYQLRLAETDALQKAGSISQFQAQQRNNEAARSYRQELEKTIRALRYLADVEPDLEGLKELITQLQTEIVKVGSVIQDTSFLGSMRTQLGQLSNEWSAVGQNIAGVLTGTVQSAVNGVSQSIMGMIDGTTTWGQVFAQVARSVIANLISIVLQYTLGRALIFGINMLFGLQEKAFNTSQAATAAAAWAPAAIAASIASYGSAAGFGLAAYLAAMGVGTAASAGTSAVAGMAGRASGGPVDASTPYIVGERGPEIFVPKFNGTIIPNIAAPRFTASQRSGGAAAAAPVPDIRIYVVDTEAAARRVMESNLGAKITVRHVRNNSLPLGMQS